MIDLKKKATQALKIYLRARPPVLDDRVFLDYEGEGVSDPGVKKLVQKYAMAASIQKKVSAYTAWRPPRRVRMPWRAGGRRHGG